jgi:diguanylate cyclase (GGDEF)-like protein
MGSGYVKNSKSLGYFQYIPTPTRFGIRGRRCTLFTEAHRGQVWLFVASAAVTSSIFCPVECVPVTCPSERTLQRAFSDAVPSSETLLAIVRAQTEIAKLGLDLGGVMSFVTERVQQLTHADGAVLELAEGDEMVYRASSGIAATLLGLRLKRNGSLSGLCVESGEILRCVDSEIDARVDREACRRVGLRSMIVTPLRHMDTTVGVLKVVGAAADAFTDGDIRALELMSELIAAAMFHAAKHETSELYLLATRDALTGLPNRALFYDRLRQAIHLAQRSSEPLGILNLDLNDLKPINDRYGHRAGDAAIKAAADRMHMTARRSDTVARVGGDEFAVILPGIHSKADAERLGMRMVEQVREPFEFEGRVLDLDISVGAAVLPDDGVEMTTLIDRADQAMYEAKRMRKEGRT